MADPRSARDAGPEGIASGQSAKRRAWMRPLFLLATLAAWLGRSEKFARLDALAERHGGTLVAITRLIPIFPFNLLNYGFGLTRVRFRTYLLWTFVCMLPGTALYVIGADVVTRGLAEGRVPWALAAALASVIVLLVLVARRARRLLATGDTRAAASEVNLPRTGPPQPALQPAAPPAREVQR